MFLFWKKKSNFPYFGAIWRHEANKITLLHSNLAERGFQHIVISYKNCVVTIPLHPHFKLCLQERIEGAWWEDSCMTTLMKVSMGSHSSLSQWRRYWWLDLKRIFQTFCAILKVQASYTRRLIQAVDGGNLPWERLGTLLVMMMRGRGRSQDWVRERDGICNQELVK